MTAEQGTPLVVDPVKRRGSAQEEAGSAGADQPLARRTAAEPLSDCRGAKSRTHGFGSSD